MNARGFTLVEVLIALALFGLMLTLVFGVLTVGARSWEAAEPQAAALDDRLSLGRFLRRRLAAALVWPDNRDEPPLQGEATRLRFIAFPPLVIDLKGPQRFELYRRGEQLVVEVLPLDGEVSEAEVEMRRLVLLEGVEHVRFRYFDGEDWFDTWDENRLPQLVEVAVKAAGPAWPPWVVRLRHGQSGAGVVTGNPFEFGGVPIR
ncbi:general secretion pathway protein J [Methylomarinovum caldicuralii]|uniref:Type II secretion system protein J n=1 Tax=Methylomarinovum caldicuralii TaxID=438856 RepID=A0AAU9BTM3_9GAMM|nr:type II secretion system protein GspJ [Methylomarinovum caldicuralii]BCX81971.1 general secretion pathway protein J [Methylomarinovum caldicuralii]